MALNELHEGKGLPSEWFTEQAVQESRWLLPFTRRMATMLDHGRASGKSGEGPEESLYTVAAETLDALEKRGRNPGFGDAAELADWVGEFREASADEEGWSTLEELGAKLPVVLLRPLDRYAIEVDMVLANRLESHEFQYLESREIGGPNELRLEPLLDNGKFRGLRARGAAEAANLTRVIRKAESLIDDVCGTLRALGLARFVPLPQRIPGMEKLLGTAVLPEVKVTGAKWRGEPVPLDTSYVARLSCLALTVPKELDDLQRRRLATGDLEGALSFQHRTLHRVLGSATARAFELRAACRRVVQAELSSDFGILVTLAFSAIEGLLLESTDKEEVTGRLSEAVSHGLGRSVEHRATLRKRVKDLYKKRSQFVHRGSARQTTSERHDAVALAYQVVRHEMELLGDEPTHSERVT